MAAKAMEQDKPATTIPGDPSGLTHVATATQNGAMRIDGEDVDISPLAEPITFEFSGRTAKNRFLKAPMTERLCHWNKEGEDIVRTCIAASRTRGTNREKVFQRRTKQGAHPSLQAMGRG